MLILVLSLFVFFNLFYFWGRIKKDFGVIDIAWALSALVVFASGLVASPSSLSERVLIVGVLTAIWALRLSGYVLYRNLKLGKEDYRYAAWREEWGTKANIKFYLRVYMLQAILAGIVASPIYLIQFYPEVSPWGTALDYLGLAMWLVGFFFESVSDFQKNKFKSIPQNKGKILTSGLWKFSRHPNYFGEALLWWGIFVIAINQVPFYFAMIGPLLLHIFLIKVSGVFMLEQKYKGRPEYDDYKKVTNAFVPWFPKSIKTGDSND